MTNVIKVKFLRNGQPSGRAYTYYTPEPVEVGDVVDLNSTQGVAQGVVVAVDVPVEEILVFGDGAKAIIGKHQTICECERCDEFVPIGEGDHICEADMPPKMILLEYQPTDEYGWCKGKYFKEAANAS